MLEELLLRYGFSRSFSGLRPCMQMTSKLLLARGRMELHVLQWGQRSANIACDTRSN